MEKENQKEKRGSSERGGKSRQLLDQRTTRKKLYSYASGKKTLKGKRESRLATSIPMGEGKKSAQRMRKDRSGRQ